MRIQEQVHRLKTGSIPRSITLILQDDLVDKVKPGDAVTVVGVLRKRWKPLVKHTRPDLEVTTPPSTCACATRSAAPTRYARARAKPVLAVHAHVPRAHMRVYVQLTHARSLVSRRRPGLV